MVSPILSVLWSRIPKDMETEGGYQDCNLNIDLTLFSMVSKGMGNGWELRRKAPNTGSGKKEKWCDLRGRVFHSRPCLSSP